MAPTTGEKYSGAARSYLAFTETCRLGQWKEGRFANRPNSRAGPNRSTPSGPVKWVAPRPARARYQTIRAKAARAGRGAIPALCDNAD